MDWTSLIIIVLIGGYPRPSRRFVLVIIPAQPRRHGLNCLAVLPARPRPPDLGVIILAGTEQLRGDEATVVAVILAENPRLGRAGEHEHGGAHEKNPFHDAPCFACRAPPGPAAVATGSGWLSNTNARAASMVTGASPLAASAFRADRRSQRGCCGSDQSPAGSSLRPQQSRQAPERSHEGGAAAPQPPGLFRRAVRRASCRPKASRASRCLRA